MSDHLRLKADHFAAIALACHRIPLSGCYASFQRRLADALRSIDAEAAAVVRGLKTRQVRTLRTHLERQATRPQRQPASDLTFHEWRAISRAYDLVQLRGSQTALHGRLLQEVGESEPALAAKLGRLGEGEVAALYRRVKGCKRWCP